MPTINTNLELSCCVMIDEAKSSIERSINPCCTSITKDWSANSLTGTTNLQLNKFLGPPCVHTNLASKPFCLLTRRDQVGASAFHSAATGIQAVNRFSKSNPATSDKDDD